MNERQREIERRNNKRRERYQREKEWQAYLKKHSELADYIIQQKRKEREAMALRIDILEMVILGIIANASMRPGEGCSIATSTLENRLSNLGYRNVSLKSDTPKTLYDHALDNLIEQGIIEEIHDLHVLRRYRLKRKEAQRIYLQ